MTDWKPRYNPWLIALTVTLATFMEVLDTSIANVALPHIAGNLSAGVDESTWVLTSYLVANAIILPLSAWFSSLMGRKNYYMLSVGIFTISSFLSGLAPNLFWLVTFRILQGLGGGGLQPSEQAILADTFPAEKLGMGMAVYGVAVVTAPIIGPTLGGWITDNFSWRWIFFINIPVGLLSIYLTSRIVEDPPHLERRAVKGLKVDFVGLSAVALGIGALQIFLDKGQREDWFASHFIVVMAVLAAAGLIFAVLWELRQSDPIVDFRLMGERSFSVAILLMFTLGFILYGSTVLLPLFLQTLMGYSATTSGLVLSPGGLVTMMSMPLVGFLLSKVDARRLVGLGMAILAVSLFQMGRFNLQIDYRTAMMARVVQSAGLAFLFIPINTVAYSFVAHNKRNQASGLINFARNIGGSVGIAFCTTMIVRYAQKHQSVLVGHATPMSPIFQSTLQRMAEYLHWAGQPLDRAHAMSLGMAYGELVRQANMLAYADVFRLMGYVSLFAIALVFLLKKNRPPKDPLAVH